jgi:uncharacterized protein YdaU (DUF1376 family)
MPLYVGDYLADTGHLTAHEHGAYLLLLMHQWRHGSIPNNPDLLTRIARVHPPLWGRTWRVLSPFFDVYEGGVLVQKRMKQEISKAIELSNKRRSAALQMHSNSRAKAHTVTVTSTSTEESKKERKKPSGFKQTRYSDEFEEFWKAYPRTPIMSKKEAFRTWNGISEADHRAAVVSLNAYKAFLASKPDHPAVHACRFLSQRRFDGFAAEPKSNGGWRPGLPTSEELRAKYATEPTISMVESGNGSRKSE